ncbi:MAG TPA: hypothetical protein VE616_03465, partial [Candidatus Udaeobacter sp.]|nr:hypothetical protein [Candidatus Udaeobacter sp.]
MRICLVLGGTQRRLGDHKVAPLRVVPALLGTKEFYGTKIIFNGKEYASPEAMPEEVRQAYQQALAHLADADRNGIPDILERGAAGNVIAIQQSSITIDGREYKTVGDMPAVVRRLFELAVG